MNRSLVENAIAGRTLGEAKAKCDFCGKPAKYDGKTKMGPWAYMCELHFKQNGVGLGTGKGQRLKESVNEAKDANAEFKKMVNRVDTELARVKKAVARMEAAQKGDKGNWGRVGDIKAVYIALTNIAQ